MTSSPERLRDTPLTLYRLALRAFPADFRAAYGRELVQAYRDARADAPSGRIHRLRFFLGSLTDAVIQGFTVRIGRITGQSAPVPPPTPGSGVNGRAWGTSLELLWSEARLAARSLRRHPGFSAAVVLTLGASLAGVTTVWGIVYHVALAPLGFTEEDRLVRVWYRIHNTSQFQDFAMSDGMIEQIRGISDSFEGLAHVRISGRTTIFEPRDGPSERVQRLRVGKDFFDVLGVEASLGRTFTEGDEEQDVVVLSNGAWIRRFGADDAALGRTITLDGDPHTVVGVLPEGFRWLDAPDEPVEFWSPVPLVSGRFRPFLYAPVARLRPGISALEAENELDRIVQTTLIDEYPEIASRPGRRISVTSLHEDFLGWTERRVTILKAALTLVGALAIVNVVLLLLMRTVSRARESAIRVALGGGTKGVLTPAIAELGILLSGAGVLAGVTSHFALTWVRTVGAAGLPRADAAHLSLPVLAGSLAMAAAILMASMGMVGMALKRIGGRAVLERMAEAVTGGAVPASVRAPLIVSQVTISVVLLAGTLLLGRSYMNLSTVDIGFSASEDVLTGGVVLPTEPFWVSEPENDERWNLVRVLPTVRDLHGELRERLQAHPAVVHATLAMHAPLSGRYGGMTPFRPEWYEGPDREMPGGRRWVAKNDVEPDFLPFLGVQLLEGRWFTSSDDGRSDPVALISRDLANAMWPAGDAVGSRFRGFEPRVGDDGKVENQRVWVTVVGVVESLREEWLYERNETVYRPLAQTLAPDVLVDRTARGSRLRIFVRHSGDASTAVQHMRSVVDEFLPGVPLEDVSTMSELAGRQLTEPRFYASVFGAFGALATLLALGGIGAVIGYGVRRRTREIGVRMSLGAWTFDVFRLVTLEILVLTATGAVLGVAIAYLGGRILEEVLFGVTPQDPLTLVSSAAAFLAMALAAAAIPTRWALRVDPAVSLRHE